MPILLQVDQLEPGMFLSRNIVNDYHVLLPTGRRLTGDDINVLGRRFPEMMVQVGDPVLDSEVEFQDDTYDTEVSEQVRHHIKNATQKVGETIRSGMDLRAENIAGIQSVIDEMMQYLQENPVTFAILDKTGRIDQYVQEHAANVFYLSLVIGNTIRNYIKTERERLSAAKSLSLTQGMNMKPLATAAFFMDIGMLPLESLYHKNDPLSTEEIDQIKGHPTVGAEMLPHNVPAMAKLAIRCHHENMDGSGYPDGLVGNKINIFSRILRIADAYSSATADKVYQKALSPVRAMYEMHYTENRLFYDPIILKVFASVMHPLPIGAKIRFDNGQFGVVVRHNPKSSFQPQVILAYDDNGHPFEKTDLEPPFKLTERDDLRVERFGEEDISYINYIPDPEELAQIGAAEILSRSYEDTFDLMYP
jgi:HD-GYP domain-containing protein (c-di-GMP phosphodiesterase class II)